MKLLDLYNEIKVNLPKKIFLQFNDIGDDYYGELFLLDKTNYPYKMIDSRAYYSGDHIVFKSYNDEINDKLNKYLTPNIRGLYRVPVDMVKIKK